MKRYIITLTNLHKAAKTPEVVVNAASHVEGDHELVFLDEAGQEIAKFKNPYVAGWRIVGASNAPLVA